MTRLHFLVLGILGLLICVVWGLLTAILSSTLTSPAPQTVAEAPTPTLLPTLKPARGLPPTWTPTPTEPPATPTRVIPLVTPLPAIRHDIVSQKPIFKVPLNIAPEAQSGSVDSQHLAYVYPENNGHHVFSDGKKHKTYASIDLRSLLFSPDSQHLAYIAGASGKQFVVLDGQQGKPYDKVRDLTFSPDSRHIAYIAKTGDKLFAVIDNQEGKRYDGAGGIMFSPESKRVAYVAVVGTTVNNKSFLVLDGKEGKIYDGIVVGSLAFSPNGQRVAFVAQKSQPKVSMGMPGLQLADFRIQSTSQTIVVVDGKEDRPYMDIGGAPIFSPDNQHVAYVARTTGRQRAFGGEDLFHPAAFTAQTNSQCVVVLDGKEEKPYDCVGAGSLTFSPDSQRLAYGAKLGSK